MGVATVLSHRLPPNRSADADARKLANAELVTAKEILTDGRIALVGGRLLTV